jgi:hypothetical protein
MNLKDTIKAWVFPLCLLGIIAMTVGIKTAKANPTDAPEDYEHLECVINVIKSVE